MSSIPPPVFVDALHEPHEHRDDPLQSIVARGNAGRVLEPPCDEDIEDRCAFDGGAERDLPIEDNDNDPR